MYCVRNTHDAAVSLTACVLCFRWISRNQTLPGCFWLLVFPTRCTQDWALEAALVLVHQQCRELTLTRYVYTVISLHTCTLLTPLLCTRFSIPHLRQDVFLDIVLCNFWLIFLNAQNYYLSIFPGSVKITLMLWRCLNARQMSTRHEWVNCFSRMLICGLVEMPLTAALCLIWPSPRCPPSLQLTKSSGTQSKLHLKWVPE